MISMFEQGAFVVNINGRPWHAVAIDEAHEMLINKACKTAIVKPNPDYISRISRYLPYRTKCLENLTSQLFPNTGKQSKQIWSPISSNSNDIITERNIMIQITSIENHSMLATNRINHMLYNPFTSYIANSNQSHDLLNFRTIGQRNFLLRISSVILKQPSTNAPIRKQHLNTFTEKKHTKQKISQLEKDKQLILSAMRKKMQFSKRTGQPIDHPDEQVIELPLALCDNSGNCLKRTNKLCYKISRKKVSVFNIICFFG